MFATRIQKHSQKKLINLLRRDREDEMNRPMKTAKSNSEPDVNKATNQTGWSSLTISYVLFALSLFQIGCTMNHNFMVYPMNVNIGDTNDITKVKKAMHREHAKRRQIHIHIYHQIGIFQNIFTTMDTKYNGHNHKTQKK